MIKILMLGKPGGTLGFTYDQHIIGLNSDFHKRFSVESFENFNSDLTYEKANKYDIFWFYAKAFQPQLFQILKNAFPNKKFVVGPNVLLDKPDIGICDQWDYWLVNHADFDLHLDQVEFYNDHVKKFIPEKKRSLSTHLDKCMRLEIFDEEVNTSERSIDCLVYSKKRRYDYYFENFRKGIIEGLEKRNLKYKEIVYGSYEKKDFLDTLLKTKVMLNLSLDECPGILNYEAFYCNTHVIGSPHNVPSHYDERLWVYNTDRMTKKYLVRNKNASEAYLEKVDEYFKKYDCKENELNSPREYVLNHTSYQRYCDDVFELVKKFLQ